MSADFIDAPMNEDGTLPSNKDGDRIGAAAQMAQRMTLLARLLRTLQPAEGKGLDLSPEGMSALLANINRRPLVRGKQVFTSSDVLLVRMARAWPVFSAAAAGAQEPFEKFKDGGWEQQVWGRPGECGRRAVGIAGRVGDGTWEDACVGELAALVWCEVHVCAGEGPSDEDTKTDSEPDGDSPVFTSPRRALRDIQKTPYSPRDFPVVWGILFELTRLMAAGYLEAVLRLRSITRWVASALCCARCQDAHRRAFEMFVVEGMGGEGVPRMCARA